MKRDFPPLFLSIFLAQKKLLFFAHEIICIKKSKGPEINRDLLNRYTATTYSSGTLPSKYHRR